MIEREELCISHLESLHRTGGEAKIKSNTSNDPNRNLVYIELEDNKAYYDIGRLSGRVIGLKLDYGDTVVDSECLEYGCLYETGVWTTATKTDISRVNGEDTEYWVRGPLDGSGNTYVVDIGYIYIPCSETSIREENLPLKWDSSFKSIYSIPIGIKLVKLKKITPTQSREILYHMGKYEMEDNLSRHQTGYLLDYKYDDQKVDLEELSFSLISLLVTTYYRPQQNRYVFRDYGYVDEAIQITIKDNLSRLSRLIDINPSSKRYGSIPRYPATYSEPSQIYGDIADSIYQNPILELIEDGCVEDGCLSASPNETLISREVNNRALSWLLYGYSMHRVGYSSTSYIRTISLIGTYLLKEIDTHKGLMREGWTHNEIYNLSTRIDLHLTSTSIAALLGFLQAYTATREQVYLDKAGDLCDSILSLLYDKKTGLFIKSYQDPRPSIEATIYGLLLAWMIGRSDIIEKIIKAISLNVKDPNSMMLLTPIVDTIDNPVVNTEGEQIYLNEGTFISIDDPMSLSFLNPFYDGEEYTSLEVLRLNTILYNVLSLAIKDKYNIPFMDLIEGMRLRINEYLTSTRSLMSLSYVSECSLSKSIWGYELSNMEGIDLSTLKFYRNFLYERLRKTWPLEYTWVSELSRSPKGILGSILRGMSKASANLFTQSRKVEYSTYLNLSNKLYLDDWANDLLIKRMIREDDTHLRSRIRHTIVGGSNTANSIKECLSLLDFEVSSIRDTWHDILIVNSNDSMNGTPLLGEGFISGPNYATPNIFVLSSTQVIGRDITEEVERLRSAGVLALYEENLRFEHKKNILNRTCFIPSYIDEGTIPYIIIDTGPEVILLHEDTSEVLLENGEPTNLETGNIVEDNSYLIQGIDGFIPL